MSDASEMVARTEVIALAARIRELEAQLIQLPGNLIAKAPGTDACTNCHTGDCTRCGTGHCTNCAGDKFEEVLLPGELERLSGAALVNRLQSARPGK